MAVSPVGDGCGVFRAMCDDPQPTEPPKVSRLRMFRRGSFQPFLVLPDHFLDATRPSRRDDDTGS